jgi:hypothetical protein
MEIMAKLPKSIEKTINDLARAREKAAKQKYLLDLGESLVMHLCAFVLGEYKDKNITSVDLEKSFLKNSKNVSFGIYLGWLRESSKFLNQHKEPSIIQNLLHNSNELYELSYFIKIFEKLKVFIEEGHSDSLKSLVEESIGKDNLAKTNLLAFFDSFIQLRNRVAHPHKEVKGKMVVWPFSESYFDATNAHLENALKRVISELNHIWEFKQFVVDANDEGVLTLLNEDSGELEEIKNNTKFEQGSKVFANTENKILLSDWKQLLKAGEEAIQKIRQEEEDLRNKATIEDLKVSIQSALDDNQISLDELNFFESLGKTKLGLSKDEMKKIIIEVASDLGIEDPFPDVDKRFIEVIDQAIQTKTYNEFLLKLTGQQYGVDNATFEKVFLERTFALSVDPEEIKKNRSLMFSANEFTLFQDLMRAQQWLANISLFNRFAKESLFKIKEDSYTYGTKEFYHRNSFLAVENFVKSRLDKLVLDTTSIWTTKQNNWQIGAMTGYAWCSVFPQNAPSKKILALNLTIHHDSIFTGFLPDWKDYKTLENYGLLLNIFRQHLKEFTNEYKSDLEKFPQLKVWDSINNLGYYSLFELSQNHAWYFDYLYGFDMIQFVIKNKEIHENPMLVAEYFDISFNLFSGLFEGVNRDYLNLLQNKFEIQTKEQIIVKKLQDLVVIPENYGLVLEKNNESQNNASNENENGETVNNSVDNNLTEDFVKGSCNGGSFSISYQVKQKGYPLLIQFKIAQNFLDNKLDFIIQVSCAGYSQEESHLAVEKVLESMRELTFENATFNFMRSKLLMVLPINEIENFNPKEATNFFLSEFSTRCAYSYTSFLGLRVFNPKLQVFEADTIQKLDEFLTNNTSLFSNQIYQERNWIKGYRFIDYVYSNKTVLHWLGWGLEFKKDQLYAGIIFHVKDSLKGALFREQMEVLSAESIEWKYEVKGKAEVVEPEWIFENIDSVKLSASTEYNRNYMAKHADPTNQKTFWCAAKKDDEQWLQLDFSEPKELLRLKILGAPHEKTYTTVFNLVYSLDGKTWTKISNIRALERGDEIKYVEFSDLITAKIIRLQPIEFVGWPSFRVDAEIRKIVPSKIELQWMVPISTSNDLENVINILPTKIQEIKTLRGLGF